MKNNTSYGQNSQTKLLKRLWNHINQTRKLQLFFLVLLMILVAFAEVVSIGAVLPFLTVLISPGIIFDHWLAKPVMLALGYSEPSQLLLPITLGFIGAVIIANLLRMSLYWIQLYVAYKIGSDLSVNIFRGTLFQPYSIHLQRNSSEVIAAIISKSDAIVGQTVLPLMVLISSFVILLVIAATLLWLNPFLTSTGMFGFILSYILIAHFFKKRIERQGNIISEKGASLIKVIQESLGGIRDVLIDGTQNFYCRIFKDIDTPLKNANAKVFAMIGMPRYLIEALGVILMIILAYELSSQPSSVAMAVPILGGVVLCAQRLLPILQQAYASWSSMSAGKASLIDVLMILESPLPDYAFEPSRRHHQLTFSNEISIENIGFSYESSQPEILRNVTLKIPKGARIGIIGTTGSGKSTLLDIMMGLLVPTSGDIFIDGCRLTPENLPNWQACLAHVPQQVYIADASIAENIAFGISREDIDWDRVMNVARQAQISDVIESWPQKYLTKVGERGARLSGGQRQRIGIARALYKNAQVIILDEATSSLDSETEQSVMQSLNNLDKNLTVIMVAHRLSTLHDCSHIVRLGSGIILEALTYDELSI